MGVLKKHRILIFLFSVLLISCDYKDNEELPEADFVKYIDAQSGDRQISVVDVKQLSDGSMLVLGNIDVNKPYVLKFSEKGEVIWESKLEGTSYFRAVPDLIESNGKYYFTCFDNTGENGTALFEIGEFGGLSFVKILNKVTYTLSTSGLTGGGMLVQSYDADGRRTILSRYNARFEEQWRERYSIYEDLETPTIYNHVTGRTQPLPFFCREKLDGANPTTYYMNGLVNYNFAMSLINSSNGAQTGSVQGNRYEALISSATYLGNNQFALSRFIEDGKNYLIPNTQITNTSIIQGTLIEGEYIPHWEDRSIVSSAKLVIDGQDVVGFVGNTKSGKLELRLYSLTDNSLLGTTFLGGSNFLGFGKLFQTNDGGVAIVAQTAFEDRFFKLALFKLSPTTLEELID